jgi:tetratricopeptide (TPR) repeat protein
MYGSRQPFSKPVSPTSMAREIIAFEQALATTAADAGPDDPATLAARARVGYAYVIADRFDAGVNALTENLAASERVLGPDHPDVFVARNDLAWAWRVAGQLPEAMAAHENCIADLDRVLGPRSAQAARARIDYARLLALTGGQDRARHLEEALASLEAAVGPEHPDTFLCQMDLAAAHQESGQTDEAVAAAERTASNCERLLAPGDPDAISCRVRLAAIYRRAGRNGEALALLDSVRADCQEVMGPEHTLTIRCAVQHAFALHDAGEHERAQTEFEEALEVAGRVVAPQDRLLFSIRLGLADCYGHTRRPADAALMLEQAARDFRSHSPGDTARLRRVCSTLALRLLQAGRATDGIAMAEELVADLGQAGEPADKVTVDGRLLLAGLYASASRHEEARSTFKAVLPDVRRVYGRIDRKTRQVEEYLRPATRIRQSKVTVVATGVVLVALAVASFVIAQPRSHPFAPPPKPGYESPANAVAGYTAGLFTRHPALACRYAAPSERGICTGIYAGFAPLTEMTGSWTIGRTAISGNRAIVDVEYHATGYDGKVSMDNTDPNAGLPNAGLSFDAAYRQVFSSHYVQYATDCVLVGGLWYVDDVESGS